MSDTLKSSWQLALEKLQAKGETISEDRLTEDQKQRINDLRQQFSAKSAELEIMFKDKINSLRTKVKPEEYRTRLDELEKQYREDIAFLKRELESKIASIRTKS